MSREPGPELGDERRGRSVYGSPSGLIAHADRPRSVGSGGDARAGDRAAPRRACARGERGAHRAGRPSRGLLDPSRDGAGRRRGAARRTDRGGAARARERDRSRWTSPPVARHRHAAGGVLGHGIETETPRRAGAEMTGVIDVEPRDLPRISARDAAALTRAARALASLPARLEAALGELGTIVVACEGVDALAPVPAGESAGDVVLGLSRGAGAGRLVLDGALARRVLAVALGAEARPGRAPRAPRPRRAGRRRRPRRELAARVRRPVLDLARRADGVGRLEPRRRRDRARRHRRGREGGRGSRFRCAGSRLRPRRWPRSRRSRSRRAWSSRAPGSLRTISRRSRRATRSSSTGSRGFGARTARRAPCGSSWARTRHGRVS